MPAITLTHNGESVEKWLESGDEAVEKGISKGIAKATLLFEGASAKEAPADTGRLRGGITSSITPTVGTIFTTSKYAKYVHDGTKPHRVSGSKLKAWAIRKGLNPYAVAKSISRKGTRANPFFTRALKKNKIKAVSVFEKEIDRAIESLDNK